MKNRLFIKIFIGLITFVLLIAFISMIFVDPWVGKKIQNALNEKNSKYHVDIEKVHVSIFTSGLDLETISIFTKQEYRNEGDLNGKIESVKCKGISLINAIFKNDIEIDEVVISDISGKIPLSEDSIQPVLSSMNIHIGIIFFDNINLAIKASSSAKAYVVNKGVLKIYDITIKKSDTISIKTIKSFDFEANELHSVSSDSMYINTVNGINYSATSKTIKVDSFSIHPNYKGYDFTSRHKFQSDCIEASFINIHIYDFSAEHYLESGSLISSYFEIAKMDINVFRDRRKTSSHSLVPMFQEIIYSFPNKINIDSIGLLNGKVTYTEHAEKANHPGTINFNKINAKIYRITNDTIFKKEKAFFEIKSSALLMGKGKLNIILKSQLFDRNNTFSLHGKLSDMEANELNPMLERNAFLHVKSGRIDDMNFSFTANKNKSTGEMTLLYHGLDIAIKNKETDETTAIKEKIFSLITNIKIMNSNPLPGKKVRIGIISFDRNPEASPFNYCAKSILSGIKSSIAKSPSKKKEVATATL